MVLHLKQTGHKRGAYSESTLKRMLSRLQWLSDKVNLDNPERVRQYIVRQQWSSGFKNNLVKAYNHYADYFHLPKLDLWFAEIHRIPKVPTTEQLSKLIAHANPKYALILSLLKETGVRPIEISRLTLKSLDFEKRTVIAPGAKLGKKRELKLTTNTVAMFKAYLAKHEFTMNEQLFPKSRSIRDNYLKIRRNAARKLGDPALRQIRLYDFRHYFGSMLYHNTKDILYVKEKMGHKRLENTMIYTHLVDFQSDEWTCRVAKDVRTASDLIERGFEYVTDVNDAKLFRKRK